MVGIMEEGECSKQKECVHKCWDGVSISGSIDHDIIDLHKDKEQVSKKDGPVMHHLTSLFLNSRFHKHQDSDEPCFRNKSCAKQYLPGSLFGPYSFINVSCGREEMDTVNNSCKNTVEAAVLLKIVHKLFQEWHISRENLSIVILSPYTAQVEAIQERIGLKYANLNGFSLEVMPTDGSKVQEADIVILSTVRSYDDPSFVWISNPDQINVAFTMARHCLWIVGNGRTLYQSNSTWKLIVNDAKHRNCFHDAEEDKDLAKLMLEVKNEFNQLDDLLNTGSMLFKNARWKVYFSANFRASFQQLKSYEMKKLVNYFLVKLAGGWRPKKRRAVTFCDSSLQILKQFKVKNLYVIVSVDIMKDSIYTQVLKIWDILASKDVPDLVKRLNAVFARYTDEYLSRCKEKCIEGDLEVPRTWNYPVACYKSCRKAQPGSSSDGYASHDAEAIEDCKISDSVLLMKFYLLSSDVMGHMLSGCDGKEVDYPFELTEQEKEIILRHRSCFVLGRSGTGKTTVVVMKLFQREQLHHIASEGLHDVESSDANAVNNMNAKSETGIENKKDILRQVFVTVSARLCYVVKKHISGLTRYTCGWNYSVDNNEFNEYTMDEASLFSDIPDSFVDLPQHGYPLVLTFHKFLMMLDGTIGTSFFEKFPEVRDLCRRKQKTSKSSTLQTLIRRKEVTYGKFCSSYWPHFNMNLTKRFDPSIVFKEIMSHIKGGCQVGLGLDSLLSREEYVKLCENRVSMFCMQDREMIYDIFVQYEKRKVKSGEFDLADLVIDLHCRLMDVRYEGDLMDFVYIDDVQDLTMRQISLFKYICRNVGEGFAFAGDTAQAIAMGVEFRFQDIRSLFYREFMQRPIGSEAHGMKGKGQMDEIFCLSQNFRSHIGILKLAQSVINVLYYYFPLSIDKLSPETSVIRGDSPVLLETSRDKNILSLFEGSNSSGSHGEHLVGFGAEQAILVRDEGVKGEIFDLIGKNALVLTIMECKGLEFQDVLLYNFFSTSPFRDRWRIIYGYMEEQNLLGTSFCGSFPSFDENKHMLLCSELKQLYVAITRTRQRLWIIENDGFHNPMFDYWKMLHIVQVRQLDRVLFQKMQAPSSQEEWKSRGLKLFHLQNYATARTCFEKSGDKLWVRWAEAASLRSAADFTRLSLADRAKLTEAAQIYEYIGKHEYAAECFLDMKEYEKAGTIYLDKSKLQDAAECFRLAKCYEKAGTIYLDFLGESKLQEAAECFHLGKCYEKAAEIYAKIGFFTKCLLICADAELFHKGWRYLQRWKEDKKSNVSGISSSNINNPRLGDLDMGNIHYFMERGALYFYKIKDIVSMMEFVKAFHSENLIRSFLRKVDCLDELLLLEKEWGNFVEAANIAKQKGYILEEADLREKGGQLKEACMAILSHVFTKSLWQPGSEGWPLKSFEGKDALLTRAKNMAKEVSSGFFDFVRAEANTLSEKNDNLPRLKQVLNDASSHHSIRGRIVSSRKMIDAYLHPCSSQDKVNMLAGDLISYADKKILWKQVSAEQLMYCWNLWQREINKVCENICSLLSNEDSHSSFCLNYFGINKELRNKKNTLVLIYPNMEWTVHFGFKSSQNSGDKIKSKTFVQAVHGYWSSKIFSIGMKLLEELEALFWFSVNNAVPVYGQCMLLVHMFNVSKSLIESENVSQRSDERLLRLLQLSTELFSANVFSMEWQNLSAEDIILLRELDICREMFEKSGSVLSSKTNITRGEVGIVMTILLSGILPCNIYVQIAKRLALRSPHVESVKCSEQNQDLDIDTDYTSICPFRAQIDGLLVRSLSGIMMDYLWFGDLGCDYMRPTSFLYVVERLLIIVSCSNGYFFTTKSSLLEWLVDLKWNVNPNSEDVVDMQPFFQEAIDLVACAVDEILCDVQRTQRWIREANLNLECYPSFVLRLIVIMCLVCINSVGHFDLLFSLLSRIEITSLLPWQFYCSLRDLRVHNAIELTIQAFAEALATIEDNLVVVVLKSDFHDFKFRNVIRLDLTVHRDRCSILKELQCRNTPNVRCRRFSYRINYGRKLATSSLAYEVDQLLESKSEDTFSEPRKSNRYFWLTLDLINSHNGVCGLTYRCDALWFKGKVLEHTLLLNEAVKNFQSSGSLDKCRHMTEETRYVLAKLQQLYSALELSDVGVVQTSRINYLVRILNSRRSRMEPFMDQILEQVGRKNEVTSNDPNGDEGTCNEDRTDPEMPPSEKTDILNQLLHQADDRNNEMLSNEQNDDKSSATAETPQRKWKSSLNDSSKLIGTMKCQAIRRMVIKALPIHTGQIRRCYHLLKQKLGIHRHFRGIHRNFRFTKRFKSIVGNLLS